MTTVRGSSVSNRAMAVEPFHVMRLLAHARELEAAGRRVIHMEVGEPDFPTPEPIIEAGHAALAAGKTKYTPARGLPELRATIASY
jgi:aspartate/methionine/tyrosine aminotransferase